MDFTTFNDIGVLGDLVERWIVEVGLAASQALPPFLKVFLSH